MVLKGVNWVHNDKTGLNGLERSQLGYPITKSGQMVLEGVIWVPNVKTGSNGFESSE